MINNATSLIPDKKRLLFIDMMRGIAVIWMIQAHVTNALMNPTLRYNFIWDLILIINGFVAVTFLFCAGAGFWLAASRRFPEYKSHQKTLYNHLKKIALIIFAGYWLHLPIWSLAKLLVMPHSDWIRFFESDILHNIGVSSIFAIILLLILPKLKHLSYASIILTVIIFILAPIIWHLNLNEHLNPIIGAYFAKPPISKFPLFHWSGYFFAGIFFSHFFMNFHDKKKLAYILIISSISILIFLVSTNHLQPIYGWKIWWDCHPGHNFFRLSGAVLLFALLYIVEKSIPDRIAKFISIIGQESLFIYVFHLIIVYGSVLNKGINRIFPQNQNAIPTFIIFLTVSALSMILAYYWHKFKSNNPKHSRIVFQVLLLGFLIKFIVMPY